MADWLEIVLPVAPGAAEDVAALLADEIPAAHSGAEIRNDEVVFWISPGRSEEVLGEARAFAKRWADAGIAIDVAGVELRPAVPEVEWRDAWKKYFHVTHLTRDIVVVPSWETHTAKPTEIAIHLDPGQAFGTGAHASTQLVLAELQQLRDSGHKAVRVLDCGTGSGILAIAALLIWPECTVIAVDNDPIAADAADENCAKNGVGDRAECSTTPTGDLDEQFDLVLANIQAHILRDLMNAIVPRVAPGGLLMLSGLLTTQARAVAEEYAATGLVIESVTASTLDPEWSGVRLRRPSLG